MANTNTKIQWTDTTWTVTTGCDKVSQGCSKCYAEVMSNRLQAMGVRGYEGIIKNNRWTGKINLLPEKLEEPLHWKKPRMIFVNSMSDLFHPSVPFEFVDKVYAVMGICFQHTFQILTKRPERMKQYFDELGLGKRSVSSEAMWIMKSAAGGFALAHNVADFIRSGILPDNIWLGTSCENQSTANERIPILLQIPAAIRFISAEPLLGPIDFLSLLKGDIKYQGNDEFFIPKINQIICGAESGRGARPMQLEWARSLRDQCKAAGVKFFMKQICESGYKIDYEKFPGDLKIRDYPDREEVK